MGTSRCCIVIRTVNVHYLISIGLSYRLVHVSEVRRQHNIACDYVITASATYHMPESSDNETSSTTHYRWSGHEFAFSTEGVENLLFITLSDRIQNTNIT